MACAAMRTFAKVKSSAITPRQPSVPNRMAISGELDLEGLDKAAQSVLLKPFYDFPDVLRTVARTQQQGVFGFDQNQVAHSDRGDEFVPAPEIVPLGIQRERRSAGNIR